MRVDFGEVEFASDQEQHYTHGGEADIPVTMIPAGTA